MTVTFESLETSEQEFERISVQSKLEQDKMLKRVNSNRTIINDVSENLDVSEMGIDELGELVSELIIAIDDLSTLVSELMEG